MERKCSNHNTISKKNPSVHGWKQKKKNMLALSIGNRGVICGRTHHTRTSSFSHHAHCIHCTHATDTIYIFMYEHKMCVFKCSQQLMQQTNKKRKKKSETLKCYSPAAVCTVYIYSSIWNESEIAFIYRSESRFHIVSLYNNVCRYICFKCRLQLLCVACC